MTQGEEQVFSVTVIGAMNPRIHHPSWYRAVGIIDEASERLALTEHPFAVVPPFASFQTAEFNIICQQDSWMILTRRPEQAERALRIAAEVFDRRLPETPVTGFALNFDFHKRTNAENVAGYLADCLSSTRLGLSAAGFTSGSLALQRSDGERVLAVRIEPSVRDPSMVFVGNSHQSSTTAKTTHFDLEPVLTVEFPRRRADSEACANALVEAMNALVRNRASRSS